jgi:hypothetical protein
MALNQIPWILTLDHKPLNQNAWPGIQGHGCKVQDQGSSTNDPGSWLNDRPVQPTTPIQTEERPANTEHSTTSNSEHNTTSSANTEHNTTHANTEHRTSTNTKSNTFRIRTLNTTTNTNKRFPNSEHCSLPTLQKTYRKSGYLGFTKNPDLVEMASHLHFHGNLRHAPARVLRRQGPQLVVCL